MLTDILGRIRNDPAKLLQILTPAGIGKAVRLVRGARRSRAAQAEMERRKAEFKTSAWRHVDGYSQRTTYASYEAYTAHQRDKLDGMIAAGVAKRSPKETEMFRRRFEPVALAPHSSVLCLAARLGSEVEAFIALGHFAVGIDLNPGPANPLVVSGDFHALQFADRSLDCVYTNSLDHAFDLEKIAAEVRRVLKPGGMFLLEAVAGYDEGYLVGPHDTTHWATATQFAATIARIGGFVIESSVDLTERGSAQWFQFVLRSPA
jgi:SAM-dependent methyltransferase